MGVTLGLRNCGFALLLVGPVGLGGLSGQTILVEAESFSDRGGWVIDQQSMHAMGSSSPRTRH